MLGLPVLAETDWSRRFHAYAVATDTPVHLRRMWRPEPEDVREMLSHLYSAVLHQGTVYPATAPAVRVLAGLVDEPHWRMDLDGATVLSHVLGFLGQVGESVVLIESEPANPEDPADLDAFFGLLVDDADAAWDLPDVADELMRRGLAELRAAADEIVAAVLPFVSDDDSATRRAALDAVASWAQLPGAGNQRDQVVAAVQSATTHSDRDERATAVLALGGLGADTTPWLDDDDPAIRACAALGLPDDPRATNELVGALTNPLAVDRWFTDQPARFHGHVRFTLIASLLSRDLPFEQILPAAVAVASVAHALTANFDWGPLLRAAFSDVELTPGVRPPAPANLNEAQKAFLRALVANDTLWDPRNGTARLARMQVGLPDNRADVATLAR